MISLQGMMYYIAKFDCGCLKNKQNTRSTLGRLNWLSKRLLQRNGMIAIPKRRKSGDIRQKNRRVLNSAQNWPIWRYTQFAESQTTQLKDLTLRSLVELSNTITVGKEAKRIKLVKLLNGNTKEHPSTTKQLQK